MVSLSMIPSQASKSSQRGRYVTRWLASVHQLRKSLFLTRVEMFPLCAGAQAQSYTNYFADALVAEAKRDSRIVGVHAAMGGGTGMNRVEKVRLRKPPV